MNEFGPILAILFAVVESCTSNCGMIVHTPYWDHPPLHSDALLRVEGDHPTDPHRLDFGDVPVGETAEKTLTLRNHGTDSLQVRAMDLYDGRAFEVELGESRDRILPPDTSELFVVRFRPLQRDSFEDTLTISSNGRYEPPTVITITGAGLEKGDR